MGAGDRLARYLLLAAEQVLPWLRATGTAALLGEGRRGGPGHRADGRRGRLLPPGCGPVALAVALALLVESFGRQVRQLWRQRPAEARGRGVGPRSPARRTRLVWLALVPPDRMATCPPRLRSASRGAARAGRARRRRAPVREPAADASSPASCSACSLSEVARHRLHRGARRRFDLLNDRCYLGAGVGVVRDSIGTPAAIVPGRRRRALLVGAARAADRRGLRRRLGRGAAPAGQRVLRRRARDSRRVLGRRPAVASPSVQTSELAVSQFRTIGTDSPTARRSPASGSRPDEQLPPGAARAAARQGRAAGLRGELRAGGGPGPVVLAPGVDAVLDHGTRSCGPPASAPAARSSPRRRSAAPAGWPTRPCSRGCGSTASSATTSCITSHRLHPEPAFERGRVAHGLRRARGHQGLARRAAVLRLRHSSTTRATSATAGRGSATRRCPTSSRWRRSAGDELAPGARRPVMAEIDLVSSHHPVDAPAADGPLVAPSATGRSTTGCRRWAARPTRSSATPTRCARPTGSRSSTRWQSLVSFVQQTDHNLVLVVLGDHQPHARHRPHPGHDVPISVIAHDPAVLGGSTAGAGSRACTPTPDAPSGAWTRSGTDSSPHTADPL